MSIMQKKLNGKKLNNEVSSNSANISVVQPPKDCWILDGNIYRCNNLRQMPAVEEKYKKVLDALSIPYCGEDNNLLLFWNSSYEAYEKITADLFTKNSDGTYTKIGMHTGYTPSALMCKKATELCEMVSNEIELYNFYHFFKHMLDGKMYKISLVKKSRNNRIFWNGNEIRVYSIPVSPEYSIQVLFDVNKIWHSDYETLTLNLSESLKPFERHIAGKDNSMLQKWANDLGINKVSIN